MVQGETADSDDSLALILAWTLVVMGGEHNGGLSPKTVEIWQGFLMKSLYFPECKPEGAAVLNRETLTFSN